MDDVGARLETDGGYPVPDEASILPRRNVQSFVEPSRPEMLRPRALLRELVFYEDVRILTKQVGFKEAKRRLIEAIREGTFLQEARSQVETKNLLQMGQITSDDLVEIVKRCSGQHHERSPHHSVAGVDVHILRRDGWYVKFYFVDPDTIFISVHQ